MKYAFAILLWSASSMAVSATTLSYQGNFFDDIAYYQYQDLDGRPSYSTNMRISMTIELDQRLRRNMSNSSVEGTVLARDGINTVRGTHIKRINISTDARRQIIGWNIYLCDGFYCDAFDYNRIRVSSATGDFASYDYEYSDDSQDDAGSTAYASAPGVMKNLTPVPLPGSIALLLGGLGVLGLMRGKADTTSRG